MRVSSTRAGFTLIEILIVIVILGILAMIAMSTFWNVKDRGLLASMQADLKTVATQQELYYSVHNRYASAATDLTDWRPSPGVTLTIEYGAQDGWSGTVTHVSLATAECALAMNNAPIDPPATVPGQIACDGL